jgi:peptidoglycan/xylan/chitin deacetylase (PgdA/CDA1 family)
MNPAPGGGGALVLSLDFELHWGIRDRCPAVGPCARRLHGARAAVPALLELFEEFEVAATWATVGFLFASTREELEAFRPRLGPGYRNSALSPYRERVGPDEDRDPFHFAARLVRLIHRTPRQEIATHTFSHYYCGEEGQTAEEFRADLAAARAIARYRGVELRSIVFPRNQHNPAYDVVLEESGIRAYRGNPSSPLWRFTDGSGGTRRWRRAGRLADAYAGLSDRTFGWDEVLRPSGLSDVRASAVLAPFRPGTGALEGLRLRRLRRDLRRAARSGRIVHLWWHPHNFGTHPDRNLGFLRRVLGEFAACRDRFGMSSLCMAEVDEEVRRRASEAGAGPGSVHASLERRSA